jgi:hypothetical protein
MRLAAVKLRVDTGAFCFCLHWQPRVVGGTVLWFVNASAHLALLLFVDAILAVLSCWG